MRADEKLTAFLELGAAIRTKATSFVTDSDKMCQAIHNGFAVALCIVEPESVDDLLRKSSALFERVNRFGGET